MLLDGDKGIIGERPKERNAQAKVLNVSEDVIRESVENLRTEAFNADQLVRKRVLQTLFDEIKVFRRKRTRADISK